MKRNEMLCYVMFAAGEGIKGKRIFPREKNIIDDPREYNLVLDGEVPSNENVRPKSSKQ